MSFYSYPISNNMVLKSFKIHFDIQQFPLAITFVAYLTRFIKGQPPESSSST